MKYLKIKINFMKHTQGEWSFSTPVAINNEDEPKHLISIYASNGTHICDKKIISKHLPEHLANAKLIAAAPDLLAFAQEMVKRYPNSPWICEQANSAIKKATL